MSKIAAYWSKARAKTPTVIQMEAVECGAAALGIILGNYGRFVPLEELRDACGVSRDGSKAANMLRAAKNYGLKASGYKKEPEDLFQLPLPMILFWNFNHFLVLEGIKGDKVYLNDPAMGPRTVTYQDFDQSFTGVVLCFEPGPDFQKGGHPPKPFRSLLRMLSGNEAVMAFITIAALVLVIPGLLVPALLKILVDDVLMGMSQNWLYPVLLALFLTGLLRAGLNLLKSRALLQLNFKLSMAGSARLFRHILRLPMHFFSQRMPGDIQSRFSLYSKLSGLVTGPVGHSFIGIFTALFFLSIMLTYSVWLTLITVLTSAINLIALQLVSRKRKDMSLRLNQEGGNLSGVSMSGLQLIESLKASGQENDFFNKWSGYQAKVINTSQRLGMTSQLLSIAPSVLNTVNSVAILGVGALQVMGGSMTVGMLIAYQSLMSNFTGPINQLVGLGAQLQEAGSDLTRLDDIMANEPDPFISKQIQAREDADPQKEINIRGHLEFKEVTFGYSRHAPPLIENFSLELPPGSRVSLVGGSGSGKSTVAKLVTGMERPWSGQVLLDGKPIENYSRDAFTTNVAKVDQDIFLFEGTVRENLSMWDQTMPEQDMVQAAKDASIHDVITNRPGGYFGHLSEDGGNLSGGQRQRLEIARALSLNPRILIMDEATSALDADTEKQVDDNIRRRGCTTLIIAQRLSTIRDSDLIVVLKEGKEMERGTHDQLMSKDSLYAELIKAQ